MLCVNFLSDAVTASADEATRSSTRIAGGIAASGIAPIEPHYHDGVFVIQKTQGILYPCV